MEVWHAWAEDKGKLASIVDFVDAKNLKEKSRLNLIWVVCWCELTNRSARHWEFDESFLSLDNFIELFLVQVFCSFFTFFVFNICSRYRGTFPNGCVAGYYVWYLRKCKNTKEIRRNRGFTKKKKIFFFNFVLSIIIIFLDFVYLTWPFFLH